MNGEDLTWALLAPVGVARLAALADEYRREEGGGGDDEDELDDEGEAWEFVGGTGNHSAILDREPGSEYTDEVPLAERLSRRVKGPVYVLYLHKHFDGADAVAVYERGRQTGTRGAPYALARSLGLALPGDPEAVGTPSSVRGLMVAEGVSAADAARALGFDPPPTGPLHIVDGAVGALLYDDQRGSAPAFMWELSTAFPEQDMYTIITYPDEGRFRVWVMRGGAEAGTYDFPEPHGAEDGPLLDSVKGETTPRKIADALGVPTGLINLERWG